MFSPGICWSGLRVDRSGSLVQVLADILVGCQAFEGLEALGKIVGADEVCEVGTQLGVGFVVEAFDGRVLDGAVHALDLPVIRYVSRGALSSGCSPWGRALW